MSKEPNYQYGFSESNDSMFNESDRQRKALTMLKVLYNEIGSEATEQLTTLNVGGSAGYIDIFLAKNMQHVTSIDIDESAIKHAQQKFKKENLNFKLDDALNLSFSDQSFDLVICSQVYEHVPDAAKMMSEIYRVLKPGGYCYFAAGNRLMLNEPHYNLWFLSLMPKALAHAYLKLRKKGSYYYENHLSYWGLKKLTANFTIIDYTKPIIDEPLAYNAEYMLKPNTLKAKIAAFIVRHFFWLTPGYIWLLKKA